MYVIIFFNIFTSVVWSGTEVSLLLRTQFFLYEFKIQKNSPIRLVFIQSIFFNLTE